MLACRRPFYDTLDSEKVGEKVGDEGWLKCADDNWQPDDRRKIEEVEVKAVCAG